MSYDLVWIMLLRLAVAGMLGTLIGLEREYRAKEAGMRTHFLVALGSALLMIVSQYGFMDPAVAGTHSADASRVAAQIVSGVGFLGAGMIVYRQHEVRGLTTAAGVWATAGIGMACGGRLYIVALGATALLIAVQCVLHLRIRAFLQKKSYSVKIVFLQRKDENLQIKELFGTDRFNKLVINRENGQVTYSATLTTEKEFSSTWLNQLMEEHPFILSVERCDND